MPSLRVTAKNGVSIHWAAGAGLSAAAGLDIGIMPHNFSDVGHICTVLKEVNPDRFVLAHLGGWKYWDEVEKTLCGENVYMDTAMAATLGLEPELARKIILEHVPGHIFLGSDCPWEDPAVSVSYVRSLGLAFDVTEGLLWRNAAEAIGINTEIKKAL